MGRIVGVLLTVLAIWAGVEVYTKGTDGAFGGAFAFLGSAESADRAERRSPSQRAREAVNAAHAEAAERRERMMRE